MKLSLLFTSLSTIFYIASASIDIEKGGYSLVKRDHGLPFDTLPSNTCATPAACTNIATPVTCRCSDIVTTCQNSAGQFCWGSKSLNSTTCPTMTNSCTESSFGSRTASCLCNSSNILCVDNANNYCYGSITGNTINSQPIPNAAPGSAAAASSGAVASNSAATPAVGSNGAPTMSVIGAPSNTNANAPTDQSGSDKLTTTFILSFTCALISFIATH